MPYLTAEARFNLTGMGATMFDRISRSWQLVKSSWTVLKQDQHLLVFPLISAIAVLLVIASFALPIIGISAMDGFAGAKDSTTSSLTYAVGFLFYVSLYFVIFFFNAALVASAMIRFDGGEPTLQDGLRVARSRIISILGYAVIAATVGVVLRFIQERVGFIGKIIVGMLGMGWTVATYLVVPILIVRDTGPVEAVKESGSILKKTWGENIVGQAGMGAAFGLIHIAVVMLGIALVVGAATTGIGALILLAVFLSVAGVVMASLVHAALGGIYAAALYRFATNMPMSTGFDSSAMQLAFAPKK